jgi:hypothetical protein
MHEQAHCGGHKRSKGTRWARVHKRPLSVPDRVLAAAVDEQDEVLHRRPPCARFANVNWIYLNPLQIIFPYDRIYPEQYSYMCDLKRTLDAAVRPCALFCPSCS